MRLRIKLWLDDIRNPADYGKPDWTWAKTAEEAIQMFLTDEVEEASLDHDLTDEQMIRGGYLGQVYEDGQKSGYDVVCWLEQHPRYWPSTRVRVHSANPSGAARMRQVIDLWYDNIPQTCLECYGEGIILMTPAGAGHSDDLPEYQRCPECRGPGN